MQNTDLPTLPINKIEYSTKNIYILTTFTTAHKYKFLGNVKMPNILVDTTCSVMGYV